MIITPMEMYLITRLDAIHLVLTITSIMSLILVFVIASNVENPNKVLWALIVPVIFVVAAVATPTTKQMAAILVVPEIVNNAEVQKMPEGIVGLASEWIEALRPKEAR